MYSSPSDSAGEGAGEGAGRAEVFAAPGMKGAEGGAGGAESFSAPNIGAGGGAGKVAAEAFEAPNMKGAWVAGGGARWRQGSLKHLQSNLGKTRAGEGEAFIASNVLSKNALWFRALKRIL